MVPGKHEPIFDLGDLGSRTSLAWRARFTCPRPDLCWALRNQWITADYAAKRRLLEIESIKAIGRMKSTVGWDQCPVR